MVLTGLKPLFGDNFGYERPFVLAGPCSAESETQVLEAANALHNAGVKIFRAGVWKPRTKPGGFEGIGSLALAWLAKVKEQTGMLTATEVANAAHTLEAINSGIDIIWIGARTTTNPFAVQEIADALNSLSQAKRNSITVLVKNPVNPDLELWIGAIERIYGAGIRRIGAIHRGFSSYGPHIYRNPPEWRIPIELHRRLPALPLICDPSHMGGKRELIAPLSQQALEMDFDGLFIECHCNPDQALSDATQQIKPSQLQSILKALVIPTETHAAENLAMMRSKIDSLDDELLELLAKRMEVAREIGRYKKEHRMAVLQKNRYNDLMQRRVAIGRSLDMSEDFVKNILSAIHEESVRQQVEIQKSDN